MSPEDARDAVEFLDARQRLLRQAYVSARYGWPESPAPAWRSRPETFGAVEPGCRASYFLEALVVARSGDVA
jgi:hypothetical protein